MPAGKIAWFRSFSLVVVIFSNLAFPSSLLAGDVFDEFKQAISNKAGKLKMQKLVAKYKGKDIGGRAYVVSIGNDTEGNAIVNLSTKKDPLASGSINVVVFLREYLVDKKLKVKTGHYVRFVGVFEEMRMSTLVLSEGIVKY